MTAYYDPRADWAREDAERAREAARPVLETAAELTHEVWGYLDEHAHASVTELELCEEAGHRFLAEQTAAEVAAEEGYERWLEDRGHAEALAQREWEDAHGVVQFNDAWDLAGR